MIIKLLAPLKVRLSIPEIKNQPWYTQNITHNDKSHAGKKVPRQVSTDKTIIHVKEHRYGSRDQGQKMFNLYLRRYMSMNTCI